jgi:hypothetical protein
MLAASFFQELKTHGLVLFYCLPTLLLNSEGALISSAAAAAAAAAKK